MKLIRVVPVLLIVLLFFAIPVSAVGDDNQYNAVWFDEDKTYTEKLETFKTLVGFEFFSAFNQIESLLYVNGDNYYDADRELALANPSSFDILPLHTRLALINYELYGSYGLTTEQEEFRDESALLFNTYYVSEEDVQHDIDYGCIPELNAIPEVYSYEIPATPSAYLPQER